MKNERVIVAIDSFKGSITSAQGNAAAREALLRYGYSEDEIESITVSDGGEGFCDAVASCIPTTAITAKVHGPLMQPCDAIFLMDDSHTAYLESASVCGYTQVTSELRHPCHTTSYGLGELILAALGAGARRLVVGLGGTSTCDAGLGMIQGMGGEICISGGHVLAPGAPAFMAPVNGIRLPAELSLGSQSSPLTDLLNGKIPVEIWSDTEAVFCGPAGAVKVFGPQKGITPEELDPADRWFASIARTYAADPLPGTGAAGGLGMALSAILGGRILSGGEELLKLAQFKERLSGVSSAKQVGMVITGEGHFDSQTLSGKMPARIARAVREFSPAAITFCLCGRADITSDPLFDRVIQITPDGMPLKDALHPDIAADNLRRALYQALFDTGRPNFYTFVKKTDATF